MIKLTDTDAVKTEKSSQSSVISNRSALLIEGEGYTLQISKEQPIVELFLNGRHVTSLNMASGVDTLEATDENTHLGPPTYYQEPEGYVVIWQGSSDLWAGKRIELRAWKDGFSYDYSLEGEGQIEQAHYFRTRAKASSPHSLNLFNPEPNSGLVQYTGQHCEDGKHCPMCNPDPKTGKIEYTGPEDYTTISVGRDKEFHEGNWFFTPSPFCYAVEGNGNWLALGIAAEPGSWNFTDMLYPGYGFGYSLAYDGHVQVKGSWQSPRLVCLVEKDEYSAVQRYCDLLRNLNLAPSQGRGPVQEWWKEPIFCGWGEQVSQEVHEGKDAPKAPERAIQANYERWLRTLEEYNLNPGTVVIDDKWQQAYGLNNVDPVKWPDITGFIAGQHRQGRRVLLWLKAWDAEGVPVEECILDAKGVPVAVDPGNPKFRQRFAEQVRYMLQTLDADGFKIDFTHLIPRGKGMESKGGRWGLELLRQWLEVLSEAAFLAKPDALVITHTANPYLADLVDMLRLNDVAGHINIKESIVPDMRHRARLAKIASPYWLLDSDNWPCSSREQWRDYIQAQASGEFGIPSLYHAERLGWNVTDEPLSEEDYAAIRACWATYRESQKSEIRSQKSGDFRPWVFASNRSALRQKVGQLMMVEVPGARVTQEVAEFVRDYHPSGVAIFTRNMAGPWATAKLLADLQTVARRAGDAPLLTGIDQEGGQVSHLRYPCSEMPSQMARAAAGGPEAAAEAAEILGMEMGRLGINLAFAPVVDVDTKPNNPVIGTRAFSDDPALVAECGVATIEALRRAGILSMAKHFPGHGDTTLDSHLDLPVLWHDWERMRSVELVPFQAAIAAGVDSICSAHVVYPKLDPSGLPATLSYKLMTELLREELGFKGALFSDALVMHGISRHNSGNIPPAAVAAIKAGVDCVMVLGQLELQQRCFEALLAAVESGDIPRRRLEEAVERIEAMRGRVLVPSALPIWPDNTHQNVAKRLSMAAVTVARDEAGLLPFRGDEGQGRLGVIEFASGSISPVESSRNEPIGASTLAFLLGRRFPEAQFLALHSSGKEYEEAALEAFLANCDRVIVATRSAILDRAQAAMLQKVAQAGKPTVQLALRSPYDATLAPQIGTVLLTYGDQPSGVAAAVDVLLGDAIAQGKLPIQLEVDSPVRLDVPVERAL